MPIRKLVSISKDQWMGGISIHPTLAVGGIFTGASNFDPFAQMGNLHPSLAFVDKNSAGLGNLAKTARYAVSFDDGSPKYYIYGGATNTGMYEVLATSPYTITDRSAQITTSANGAKGAYSYKGYLVYALDTSLRARAIPITGGTDTQILTGLTAAEHPMTIGADLNLYVANSNSIARVTSTTGTTNNTIAAFSLETGMTIRDLKNDGRYLVFIADDRVSGSSNVGSANCVIAYWDYASGTLTQRYDFKDGGMNALGILEGNAYVFGQDNLYVCNVATQPKPILPFGGNSNITARPNLASQVVNVNNALLWADGQAASAKIYGYGSLIAGQQKIFFQPYTGSAGTATTCLAFNGNRLFRFTGADGAVIADTAGSTSDTSVVSLANVTLDKPYKLYCVKVLATKELVSGASIQVTLSGTPATASTILGSQTFSYALDGAKQTKIFFTAPDALNPNNNRIFMNGIYNLQITTNVDILGLEVWGEEVDTFNSAF